MLLTDLETPALVVDRARLARKYRPDAGQARRPGRAASAAREDGQVGRGRPAGGGGAAGAGITVSTLREADHFLDHGFTDILYAVGIVPSKLRHVAALQRRGADLTIILDSVEMAEATAREAEALSTVFPVLIEVDTDGGRAGVVWDHPRLIEIGRVLAAAPGTELRGVMTHAGLSYGCRSPEALRAMAEQERSRAVAAAEALRCAGLPAPVVSVGSTPTALFAERLDGVSEVRAGVYMFQDLVMADLGVCPEEEIALSVLATVIGHRRDLGYLLVDAGGLACRRMPGLRGQPGYGSLWDAATGRPLGLAIASTNQEHGLVPAGEGDFERLPIGTQVRIAPQPRLHDGGGARALSCRRRGDGGAGGVGAVQRLVAAGPARISFALRRASTPAATGGEPMKTIDFVRAGSVLCLLSVPATIARAQGVSDPAPMVSAFNETCRRGFPDLETISQRAQSQGWIQRSVRLIAEKSDPSFAPSPLRSSSRKAT
jgi:D-serine deaminase-like pyridoxal phosphate-dependent protein